MNPASDRALISGLLALLLLLWLGFLVHASPRFPGSLFGGVLAITALTLMLVPTLVYMVAKRSASARAWLPRTLPMRRLLDWHVHTSILGALLAIVHSAHRFESPLGVALTAMMLAVVVTGYIGRYFLGFVAAGLHERQRELATARTVYDAQTSQAQGRLAADPAVRSTAEVVVDLGYSVAFRDALTGRAARWLRVHLALSCVFMGLLALHVVAAIYFGLRWW